MLRAAGKILLLVVVMLAGSAGIWFYQDRFAASQKIARLEEEKRALAQVVKRLGEEDRVAEILVTDQKIDPATGGALTTTLLFVEYTKGGVSLPPKSFVIEGKHAHVDAMVIKFDRHFVEEGDPLRGKSIALFTKIFGDQQSPASAQPIDRPGAVPDIYRDASPRVTQFEQELWRDFWRLTDDESYRKEKGVRVAMGQGVWGMFETGKLYRITLESDGGLSLTSQPVPGIYKEALKLH
jgi:hypothetical protein